jgi:5'-nucleotidase
MKLKRLLAALGSVATLVALSACGGSSSYSVNLAPARILAVNDIHGYLSPTDNNSTSVVPLAGAAAGVKVSTGGLAYMATLLTQLKAANPNNIMVAAGDLIGASPYTSNIAHDEPTVDVLNQLGLEVSSVGNHEFDKGLTELKRIQGSNGASTCYPSDGTFGVVGTDTCLMAGGTFSGAKWTYLAANVVNTATGQTIFPATYIKKFPDTSTQGGAKIGFVGLTFKNTPSEVNQTGVAGLTFGDEATAINQAAASLKAQGVNAVVVLIHQGGFTTSTVYGDNTCPGFNGDLLPIVDALSSDVDIVVSGHTHTDYICKRNGKLVTQSGFYGTGVTSIDLTFDSSGKMASASAVNNPVINDTNTTAYPAGITALTKTASVDTSIAGYTKLSAAAGSAVVGTIAAQVTIQAPPAGCATSNTCDSGARNKTVESAMGDLSADSQLAAFQGPAITKPGQISLIQAGGVRTNLGSATGPYPNLPITYAQLFATNPFHDTLVAVDMTGAQIKRVLEQQWEAPNNTAFYAPGGVGEILMPSKGFTYTWDSSQPAGAASGQGNRVIASSMMLNGVPMSQTATYRVVISTFLQGGGDNFTVFKQGTNPIQGGFDIAALVSYMAKNPNYQPVTPNRITKLGNNP